MHYISRPKLGTGLGRHAAVLVETLLGMFVVERQADTGARVIPLMEFEQGHVVRYERTLSDRESVAAAWRRLQAAVQEQGYDLFGKNCEHLAREIIYGVRRSFQIEGVMLIALLLCVVLVLARE